MAYLIEWEIEFEILYKGLMASNSINILNLANNYLDDEAGAMIGKLISSHSEKRDQFRWLYSIRGEQPEEDVELKGNCRKKCALSIMFL